MNTTTVKTAFPFHHLARGNMKRAQTINHRFFPLSERASATKLRV